MTHTKTSLRTPHFEAYSVGICCMSICTNLPPEEAVAKANAEYPTGIQTRWEVSEDEFFSDGKTRNGALCESAHAPEARHYLLNC